MIIVGRWVSIGDFRGLGSTLPKACTMDHDGSVTRLIELLRSRDPAVRDMAARRIWQRYFRDLLDWRARTWTSGFAAV